MRHYARSTILAKRKNMKPTPLPHVARIHRSIPLYASMLLVLLAAPASWAQTVNFRAAQPRITIPLNDASSTLITNLVTVSDGIVNPITLDVTGLPAGATYSLSTNSI